jgi:hypothetical protein
MRHNGLFKNHERSRKKEQATGLQKKTRLLIRKSLKIGEAVDV